MTSMSQEEINVDLSDEVQRLKKEVSRLKYTLQTCKYHAERICNKGYGETMDAHQIVEEVDSVLGED
ncbi:hypothetical protein [Robertmurraya massiliosenegalensis]|uniref:hypothetical protein n=1 Tax=Robertmurraya massiliosenegalensis TaxID=1287657 RepID=UPI000308A362|nr:hypothetical protein [Robertmurraya massiliosenegalensis]